MDLIERKTVLVVLADEQARASLRRIFGRLAWEIYSARDCREALGYMRDNEVSLVISEDQLPDGDWKRLLHEAHGLANPPNLVVCSHTADNRLWAEVLNLGGYDVLPTPFQAEEVARVSDLASQAWQRNRHSRKKPARAGSEAAPKVRTA